MYYVNEIRPHGSVQGRLAMIYFVFYFDLQTDSARRHDGAIHSMNTTPNSPLANEMIDRHNGASRLRYDGPSQF
jgi:hypothetical protein